ncbi:MAG: hypothetical protein KDA57_23230 [Planctomycetales bacterium]|nr:hypothetical protein [Planctomycetales bacterium]
MKNLGALVLSLALTGCSSSEFSKAMDTPVPFVNKMFQVPYESKDSVFATGGYFEEELEPNRYKVSFEYRSMNRRSEVEHYLRRRAEELCGSSQYEATEFSEERRSGLAMANNVYVSYSHPVLSFEVACKPKT